MGTSSGVMVNKLDKQSLTMSLILIGCAIHVALCYIYSRRLVNYYLEEFWRIETTFCHPDSSNVLKRYEKEWK